MYSRLFNIVETKIASPATLGEREKNVIKDKHLENLWKPGHSVANIGLDVAIHLSANRSTYISHLLFSHWQKLSQWKCEECVVCHNSIRNYTSSCFIFYAINIIIINCVISMDWQHDIKFWLKSHIGSWLIKMAKPSSVFILTGTGNPELGKEYDSIYVSVPAEV